MAQAELDVYLLNDWVRGQYWNQHPDRQASEFINKNEVYEQILAITNEEAERKGVSRATLWKIKQKLLQGKDVNLRTRAVKKLLS